MTSVLESRFAAMLILSFVSLPLHAGSDVELIDGKKITRFEHVSAGRYIDRDGERFIAIVFSTMDPKGVPLFDTWGGADQFEEWVNENGAHIASISFTEGQESNYRIDVSTDTAQFVRGLGDAGAFKSFELGKDRVVGNVHRELQSGILSGQFDALITTTRFPEAVSGPAVLESPATRVMFSLEAALRSKDFAAARELLTPDGKSRTLVDQLEAFDSEVYDLTINTLFGAPGVLRKTLVSPETKLYVGEDLAILYLRPGGGDASRQSDVIGQVLKRVDGVWKLD